MADIKKVADNFWKSLADLLNDLTTLEVSTYVTYDGLPNAVTIPINQIQTPALLQAYTKLDLDADTTILLPVKKDGDDNIALRESILSAHQAHVKLALETRAALVKALLDAVPVIKSLG